MHCMKLNELCALGFYILKLHVILLNRIRNKLSLLIQTVGVWSR